MRPGRLATCLVLLSAAFPVPQAGAQSPRPVTSDDYFSFKFVADPQLSPDRKQVLFTVTGVDRAANRRMTAIWLAPTDSASGAPRQLTAASVSSSSPSWTPDGKSIAFLSSRPVPGDSASARSQLYLLRLDGGEPRRVTSVPNGVSGCGLSPDGSKAACLSRTGPSDRKPPSSDVRHYDVASHEVRPITRGPRAVRRLSLHEASGTIAYVGNDFTHLDEVYLARKDGSAERRLTGSNDPFFAGLAMMPVERMTYTGADGWKVDGFLVKPVGWQAGRSYPMILSIHGGPAGMYGVDWYHEFHVYSARGWAVFFTNPRGSTGYGHKFQRGIAGEWGGKDYVDIMNGVDAVLAANPWIDRTRLGVTGGSYGGYMTNWIVGHTDRFKAAVTLRSISSFLSDEGTRDGAFGHQTDFGGDLFQRFDLFWDRSPLKYVQNVKTPILILHSDSDFRVPIEQGEQWFRALRHLGKAAEIVFFPRENHNLTRTGEPKHLVESLDWQVYWFTKYLEDKADTVPPDRR